ncbi:ATP-binding protein [Streptomyces sp. MBT56]|uniref:AlbA family DNA-binding domain-containing protein n=1 Tax=unclassified Streptomyces TaxID=2593676 RepID=UPI00190DC4BB|nr:MULTISPECIES: ATP-binding protein [unclassified Streptomyces]MBK3561255.1 ATP-binding protein [Streptomyces sp. MBT56]MBK3604196.1 ATP-binding protein [Streptomyces sp. MBT54]MBK3616484.1 ATP-binding protein [Streptomyces sp. MBT98]MBK6044399.1 ATP-binding protein [Streptomyces sp. MBT55]
MNNSLFAASAADLTIERIRALAARPDQVESLTLEFKREYSKSVVRTIAAMANTYGGVILVGVHDKAEAGIERVVGVDAQEEIDKIASACREKFDPPWEPAFIPVPFDDGSGRSVVVIRVDANVAPRPLLIDLQAPIRLSGQNSVADRDRLLKLAREEPSAGVLPMGQSIMSPNLERGQEGNSAKDFIFRTGINLPMGEAGAWRPLSERTVAALTQALNRSAFPAALEALGHKSLSSSAGFQQHGYNRSRTARLVYRALSESPVKHPVEAAVTVALPEVYGTSTAATVTIDVTSRLRRYAETLGDTVGVPGEEYRYPVPNLLDLLEGILKTTVDPKVVAEIARITDIDPALVPQPRELHLAASCQVKELLRTDTLREIPDAGASAGGVFRANPALDLRDIADRQEQVDDWVRQLGLDAGLTGMEALVKSYRSSRRRSR